jgi:hypothetical protein
MTEGEKKLVDVLKNKFPKAEEVHVQDISGMVRVMDYGSTQNEDNISEWSDMFICI